VPAVGQSECSIFIALRFTVDSLLQHGRHCNWMLACLDCTQLALISEQNLWHHHQWVINVATCSAFIRGIFRFKSNVDRVTKIFIQTLMQLME
jgi:hypothetical protein